MNTERTTLRYILPATDWKKCIDTEKHLKIFNCNNLLQTELEPNNLLLRTPV